MHSRAMEKKVKAEDASSYKSTFKDHKKICPKIYEAPQSIKRML